MKNNSYKNMSWLVASLALSQLVCADQQIVKHNPTHVVVKPGVVLQNKTVEKKVVQQPVAQQKKNSQPVVVAKQQEKVAAVKTSSQKASPAKVAAVHNVAPKKVAQPSAQKAHPVAARQQVQAKVVQEKKEAAVQVVEVPVAVEVQHEVAPKDDVFAQYWDYLIEPNKKPEDVATHVEASQGTQVVDDALKYFESTPQPQRVAPAVTPADTVAAPAQESRVVRSEPAYSAPVTIHRSEFDEPEHPYVYYEEVVDEECPEPTCCDNGDKVPLSEYNAVWGDQRLELGRRYAYLGVDGIDCKHWIMPFFMSGSFANRAYNAQGNTISLATSLFGDSVKLRDIYLLARISDTLRTTVLADPTGTGTEQLFNVGFISRDATVDATNISTFGNVQSDQYLYLLAPMEFNFSAEQQVFSANILSLILRYPLDCCEKYTLFFGFNLPVVSKRHLLDYQLVKGELFRPGAQREVTINENSLVEFFKNYMSVEDFLQRAVFNSKGLIFESNQRKTGFGDLEILLSFDVAFGEKCDSSLFGGHLQAGVYFDVPTASKPKGNKLWEIELGNSGATAIRPFIEYQFRRCKSWFNPVLNISGIINSSSTLPMRIPQIISSVSGAAGITEPTLVKDVPGLLIPPIVTRDGEEPFDYPANYYLAPGYTGSVLDSTVALFADVATPTRRKIGNSFVLAVGNYFYRLLSCCSRLGFFYEYAHKSCDTICPCPGKYEFDTASVTKNTDRTSHTLMWSLTQKWRDCLEFSIGSRNVIGGKNIPKTNEFFGALVLTF